MTPAGPPPPPPKPVWEQFTLNPKKTLTLDFTDSSADMVLSLFSKASGITILKDPSFKSTLTLNSAKAVHLDDAFEILNTELDLNGYTLQKRGKLMVVVKTPPPAPPVQQQGPPQAPPPPPPDDKPVLVVYKLKYTSAREIARVVNEVFTQQQLEALIRQAQGQGQGGGFPGQPQFGQPQGQQPPKVIRASSEDYSNQVVVSAPPTFQTEVAALIKDLDIATDLPLESKIFKLKHVAADDIIDAVNNVLSANSPTGRGAAKQDQNQNQFYGYYRFGGQQNTPTAGAQTATSIKESNSIVVAATHDNIEVITKLIETLDVVSDFVGTTQVIQLHNAKATDMATLLNAAFTKKKDSNNDNPFFYIYSDGPDSSSKKSDHDVDLNDDGLLVHVRDLTGKVNIMADPNTNSLIVVTLPSNIKLIQKIVDQLDKIGDQVMIETVIVEAKLDKTTKLGVEWNFLQNKAFGTSSLVGAGSNTYGLQNNTTTPNTGLVYTLTGTNYNVFLNALQSDSRFKVLDTPRIFTSNNVKATINVTTQQPYITNQQTASAFGGLLQNYDFKPIGVILTVTPRIASSGQVAMDIDQQADDLQGFTSFNAPIINHREATTSATVLDGQTIVLGGIIEHQTITTEDKIPILGDLPLLGPLFRSTSHDKTQTELLVFLTPHIVHNNEEAQKLRERETKELSPGSQKDVKNH
jgi:general secretion pathway protein D